jgi:hypothetical protein
VRGGWAFDREPQEGTIYRAPTPFGCVEGWTDRVGKRVLALQDWAVDGRRDC